MVVVSIYSKICWKLSILDVVTACAKKIGEILHKETKNFSEIIEDLQSVRV